MNASEWNERYPIGMPVIAYPLLRPEDPMAVAYRKRAEEGRAYGDPDPCERLETRTRSQAWALGHGTPVVLVDGYSGGICLTHVDPDPSRADEIGGA